jgi:glutathione S-transferase
MVLKAVGMSWLTVVRMMQVKGGFRSPEDLRKTPFNPNPNLKQLEPNEYVDRIRCRFRGKSPTIPISNRPRFRNEIAHHSEMMSPAIPL